MTTGRRGERSSKAGRRGLEAEAVTENVLSLPPSFLLSRSPLSRLLRSDKLQGLSFRSFGSLQAAPLWPPSETFTPGSQSGNNFPEICFVRIDDEAGHLEAPETCGTESKFSAMISLLRRNQPLNRCRCQTSFPGNLHLMTHPRNFGSIPAAPAHC